MTFEKHLAITQTFSTDDSSELYTDAVKRYKHIGILYGISSDCMSIFISSTAHFTLFH